MKQKIYVASSWRCKHQPGIVQLLRSDGHEVYDFRNPEPGNSGFAWSAIDRDWIEWSPEAFRAALDQQVAIDGFGLDMDALKWCETCVLVLPCGRSAHLELGYACGAGKKTAVLIPEPQEPELMYKMLGAILVSENELIAWVNAS